MSAADGCGYSKVLAASLLSEETPNMKSFFLTCCKATQIKHKEHICLLGDSPSDEGETCTLQCSICIQITTLCSVFFIYSNQPGLQRRGRTLGRRLFVLARTSIPVVPPPSSCGSCVRFISREGFGRLFPLSAIKSKACPPQTYHLPPTVSCTAGAGAQRI